MNAEIKVLSVVTQVLGNLTYGNLLKKYLLEETEVEGDFYWSTDERKFWERVITRPLYFSVPNRQVRRQNLDLRKLRSELAISYITRSLLNRKVRGRDYSAIHLHTQSIGLLSNDLMAKIPTVVSLDTTAVLASQEVTDPAFRWTYQPTVQLEKKVFESASGVVSFSDYARRSVIEDYGIDESKVVRIYPGVDLDRLTCDREARRARCEDVDSGAKHLCKILFIGGDFQRKGGEDLLSVFLECFSEVAELHLVTKQPVECNHPNVHVYLDVKAYTEEWLKLYQMADVFVMPTQAEALGHVFVEAMAVGLPVVATRLPVIEEMVVHGSTGLLVRLGDRQDLAVQLRCLVENKRLRYEMGLRGRDRVRNLFDARKNFQQLCRLWRSVSSRTDEVDRENSEAWAKISISPDR